MKNVFRLFVAVSLLACVVLAQDADESPFTVTQLTDQIYQLSTDEGSYTTNVLLFVGEDGLLLVDANAEQYAEELKKIVDGFGKGLPKYIITTHRHVEHVGGNAIFGREPVIIAHYLVPEKLRQGSYLFNDFPDETLPDITLTDSLTLVFNGEKIRMVAVAGSHDDNEILVHFTKSRIVHLSSLVNGMNFPSIDSDGDALKFADVVSRAIDLLPEDVTIVSGHNNNCTWRDLHDYRDMIIKTTEIVRQGLADGKDKETLQKEKVLAGFERFNQSYVSPDGWIEYLVEALTRVETEKKKTVYEPLYYALKDGGGEAAVAKYLDLKQNHPDEYDFEEMNLLAIGSKILGKGKAADAVMVLELCLKEFPEGAYGYYLHYLLSDASRDLGDKVSAIEHCRKSIELKPDFGAAATLLEELEKM